MKNNLAISWQRCLAAWSVHALTASGAMLGLLALYAIYNQQLLASFWLMGAAIMIDAVDGLLARLANVKLITPKVDGALLDNIVDFLNYTVVPAFFLIVSVLVPAEWRMLCVAAIIFSSAYQFTQIDAKTADHFFKGFPCYWNIVVFYLYFWQMNDYINLIILFSLAILCFIPIKYVYPSRLDYLTENKLLRAAMLAATLLWGMATIGLLWIYPKTNAVLVLISMGYLFLYGVVSLYRTWSPLRKPM